MTKRRNISNADRSLHLYRLSAHLDEMGALADYGALLSYIAGVDPRKRFAMSDGRMVALSGFAVENGEVEIIAYEGEPGVNPLLFDTQNQMDRAVEKGEREMLATKTHGFFQAGSRYGAVGYNQRGAKASDICVIMQSLARRRKGWEKNCS